VLFVIGAVLVFLHYVFSYIFAGMTCISSTVIWPKAMAHGQGLGYVQREFGISSVWRWHLRW